MPSFGKKWASDPDRLTSPLEIEGERWNGLFRSLAGALSLFIIALVAVAAVAPLNEVALTSGNILPTQHPSVLQHDEGGVVEEIVFAVGEEVKKGDVIVRLRAFQAERKQEQLKVRRSDAALSIARLEALLSGEEPKFPEAEADLLVGQELAFYQERRASRKTVAVLQARIEQRKAELSAVQKQMISLGKEKTHQLSLVTMREQLVTEGYGTRKSLIEAEAKLAALDGQIAKALGGVSSAKEALREAHASLDQQVAEDRARWSAELTRATAEFRDFQEQFSQQEDRSDRLAIRAPFDGRIQSILPNAPGEVVRAGEPIGEVVPKGSRLYASMKLLPKDAGSVSLNDRALVTLSAFDPDVFGEVQGRVSRISATTESDETGNTYYEVDVDLETVEGKNRADLSLLRPGMELQARIQTKKRTILRYFLRPVYRSLEQAFSES